jgi:hypothetical protein
VSCIVHGASSPYVQVDVSRYAANLRYSLKSSPTSDNLISPTSPADQLLPLNSNV